MIFNAYVKTRKNYLTFLLHLENWKYLKVTKYWILPRAFMYSSKLSLVIIFHVPTNLSTIFPGDDDDNDVPSLKQQLKAQIYSDLLWSNDCRLFQQLLQHVSFDTSQSDDPASLCWVPQPPACKRNSELGKGSRFSDHKNGQIAFTGSEDSNHKCTWIDGIFLERRVWPNMKRNLSWLEMILPHSGWPFPRILTNNYAITCLQPLI